MNSDQVQIERRGAQRFEFHLPVAVRLVEHNQEGSGFTQDLSARGALLFTELAVTEGARVELELVMPSEITLAENMRVRCRGKVVRVVPPAVGSKHGMAVQLEGYEFLPETELQDPAGSFARISALHEHAHKEASPSSPSHPSGLRNPVTT